MFTQEGPKVKDLCDSSHPYPKQNASQCIFNIVTGQHLFCPVYLFRPVNNFCRQSLNIVLLGDIFFAMPTVEISRIHTTPDLI